MPRSTPYRLNPQLLTIFEVAAILRVSKHTVYRLVHDGDLEAIRVGRSFRIPQHAISAIRRANSGDEYPRGG